MNGFFNYRLGFLWFFKKKIKNEWVKNDVMYLFCDYMIFMWFLMCFIKFYENWIFIKDNLKLSYYEKWKIKWKII